MNAMSIEHAMITHASWGNMEITVKGQKQRFKDCKVWPDGAKNWDWRITGTDHEPGIQIADIEEILSRDIEIMILTKGMENRLKICPETEQMLKDKHIEYHVEETVKAVSLFNELAQQGKRVGGIFHSTC